MDNLQPSPNTSRPRATLRDIRVKFRWRRVTLVRCQRETQSTERVLLYEMFVCLIAFSG